MSEVFFDVCGIVFGYLCGVGWQVVFGDFELCLGVGEVVLIFGFSGVGKFSLLCVLVGLQELVVGSVWVFGEFLCGLYLGVVVVFQDFSLLFWLNLEKNVVFGFDFVCQLYFDVVICQVCVDQVIVVVGLEYVCVCYLV